MNEPTNSAPGPVPGPAPRSSPLAAFTRGWAAAPISRGRRNLAFFIAGASDALQWVFFPAVIEGAASPIEIAVDLVTGIAILLVVGFKWRLAIALLVELLPGLDLFPTWTAVVLSLPVIEPDALHPSLVPPPPANGPARQPR